MNYRLVTIALTTAACLQCANLAMAFEGTPATKAEPASKAETSAKSTPASRAEIAARRKAAAQIKPIDINGASSEELKKLPGITDAEAAKIIAGRPYASKAWLVTNKVVDAATYGNIKGLIIAKQPYKDAARNAALYEKKK
jgi:DNA uptake protein ComE-like DNA-binding protein